MCSRALNIFLGLDSGRCKFPCGGCYFIGSPTDQEKEDGSTWKDNELRTKANWEQDIAKFEDGKPGIECHSVVYPPVSSYFTVNLTERVTCPVLHVNLGIVNLCMKELALLAENDTTLTEYLRI